MFDSSAGSSSIVKPFRGSQWAASSSNRFSSFQLFFFPEKRLRRQEHVSAGPSYRCGLKNERGNRAKKQKRAA